MLVNMNRVVCVVCRCSDERTCRYFGQCRAVQCAFFRLVGPANIRCVVNQLLRTVTFTGRRSPFSRSHAPAKNTSASLVAIGMFSLRLGPFSWGLPPRRPHRQQRKQQRADASSSAAGAPGGESYAQRVRVSSASAEDQQ
jgi:hypothetical protein